MSSVPPARSTRVGARDSILNVPCFPSFQDFRWRANHNKGERCTASRTNRTFQTRQDSRGLEGTRQIQRSFWGTGSDELRRTPSSRRRETSRRILFRSLLFRERGSAQSSGGNALRTFLRLPLRSNLRRRPSAACSRRDCRSGHKWPAV